MVGEGWNQGWIRLKKGWIKVGAGLEPGLERQGWVKVGAWAEKGGIRVGAGRSKVGLWLEQDWRRVEAGLEWGWGGVHK